LGDFLYFSLEVADNICIIRVSRGEKKMSCPDPLYDYEDLDENMIKAMEDNNMTTEEYENLPVWDPIMGDSEEWIDTDDMWLDDFQGEEEFA
jgi:hypothetical protein